MNTPTRTRLAGILFLALAGCVGPVEIAPLPNAHPAHPDAPSGTTPEVGSMLDTRPQVPESEPSEGMKMKGISHSKMGPGGGGERAGDTGMAPDPVMTEPAANEGTFECPMHARVRSDKPGRCPICGMKLVKKGGGTEHGGGHEG
jgi:hypothetical protein